MRIRDFEQAIEALDSTIKMEEAKINKGQVRSFFGHKDDTDIMWDENAKRICGGDVYGQNRRQQNLHEGCLHRFVSVGILRKR